MDKLIIIGAGGHGRVVADCAETLGIYQHIEFLDDCVHHDEPNFNTAHWQIVGDIASWQNHVKTADFVVAIGNNALRLSLVNELKTGGANVVNLVHPSAILSKHITLGSGSVIFAGAVVNVGTNIGDGCIINTSASIDHDCQIADGVHISPNVSLAGGVKVGKETWVGIGSCVSQYLNIASNSMVGAGSVVVNDLTQRGTYVGCPAKLIS